MKEKLQFEREENIYDIYRELAVHTPHYSLGCLAGLDTTEAWKLREEFRDIEPRGVVKGLAGIDTARSWEWRKEILDDNVENADSVARSLAGMNSEKAWEMRNEILEKYFDQEGAKEGLAESLAGLDGERAWELRNNLIKICSHNVFEGLSGVDSERAWKLREEYKEEDPFAVASSLCGLGSEQTQKMRQWFLGNIGNLKNNEYVEKAIVGSLVGDDSQASWELREKYLDKEPFAVATSLAGLNSKRAEETRNTLLERARKEKDEKIFKGIAQGLNSNYILEAIKLNSGRFCNS